MARPRFVITIQSGVRGHFLRLKSINGRIWNHSYNSYGGAKKSVRSLQKSFKEGHLRFDET